MLAFMENAIVQPTKAPLDKDAEPRSFEERLGSLVSQLGPKAVTTSEPQAETPKTQGTVAAALLELTDIVAQLARVDTMMAQVADSIPEEEDAKRWHEVSVQALRCSRNMLSEKQSQCLADLGARLGPSTPIQAPAEKSSTPPWRKAKVTCAPPVTSTWKAWSPDDVKACPEFVPPDNSSSKLVGSGSLRQDLEHLRERHPERVIIVRKIKKLGFDSPQLLDQHFSQYGQVSELLIAHSLVKPTAKRPNGRVRPAALGFVVMGDVDAVQRAFEGGMEQVVCGLHIELKPFESFDEYYLEEEQQ